MSNEPKLKTTHQVSLSIWTKTFLFLFLVSLHHSPGFSSYLFFKSSLSFPPHSLSSLSSLLLPFLPFLLFINSSSYLLLQNLAINQISSLNRKVLQNKIQMYTFFTNQPNQQRQLLASGLNPQSPTGRKPLCHVTAFSPVHVHVHV